MTFKLSKHTSLFVNINICLNTCCNRNSKNTYYNEAQHVKEGLSRKNITFFSLPFLLMPFEEQKFLSGI